MASESRLRSRLLLAGKVVVTAVLLVFLARKIPLAELATALRGMAPGWLAAALALVGLTTALVGIRWWLLLKTQGLPLSLWQAEKFTFIGQFFNSFLLGSTGGDAARLVYAIQVAPVRKTEAAITIALDRVLGLGFLLFHALLALTFRGGFLSGSRLASAPWVFGACLTVLCLVGALAIYKPLHDLPMLRHLPWPGWCRSFLGTVQAMGRTYWRRPRDSLQIISLAALIPLVTFVAGYCLAGSFGMRVTFLEMMLILPVVFCATSIPISISGFGVREGLFVYLFGLAGVINPDSGTAVAVAFSLTWYALGLFWGLCGGIVFVATKSK